MLVQVQNIGVLRTVPCNTWSQVRLCNDIDTFQHDLLKHAYKCFLRLTQDCDDRFPIRYRFDGKLYNLNRLQAKSTVQAEVLDEFLYVDHMVKNVETERKMQESMDRVSTLISKSAQKRLR